MRTPNSSSGCRFFNVGSRQHLRWLNGIVRIVVILNGVDALFTLFWVKAGLAEEANVLLRELVNHHAVAFVGTKLALVSLSSFLLWRYQRHPVAVIGLFAVFLAYYFILLHHLRFLGLSVGYLRDM